MQMLDQNDVPMQPQQVNPLADFMENTLSVQDLLNIYNKYAPEPLTI